MINLNNKIKNILKENEKQEEFFLKLTSESRLFYRQKSFVAQTFFIANNLLEDYEFLLILIKKAQALLCSKLYLSDLRDEIIKKKFKLNRVFEQYNNFKRNSLFKK